MEILPVLERPRDVGIVIVSISLLGYISFRALRRHDDSNKGSSKAYPLPPGPPRDFLIGSVRYFPSKQLWKTFCQWQTSYGDIVYAGLPGVSFVMLNSHEVCQELLSKRASTTSGRDAGYMFSNVMRLGWLLALLPPGPRHTNQRRMLRKALGPSVVGNHDHHVEQITNDFMLDLAEFQGYVPDRVLTLMSRVIVEIAYGQKIWKQAGTELSAVNREIMHLSELGLFNFWLVNVFHFLRFIPSWVPGATFKRIGDRTAELADFIRYTPFRMATQLHSTGQLGHCLASELLDDFGPDGDARDALGMLYQAGSDTTGGAISAFLFDMFLFPEVADRVFHEIRQVTQGQRLLQITDRSSLPYTEAVWKEAIRWNPFFTLSVPHVNSQEEVLRGFRIPKGSVIGQNMGFIFTDPKVWGDPEVFRPERFLSGRTSDSLPNPLNIVFGFGFRICPGMYLADRAGFHVAATTVSLFHILPLEGNQRPDPATVKYADMPLRVPINFTARFIARDHHAEHLLNTFSLDK